MVSTQLAGHSITDNWLEVNDCSHNGVAPTNKYQRNRYQLLKNAQDYKAQNHYRRYNSYQMKRLHTIERPA
jgi:hypothetical protein